MNTNVETVHTGALEKHVPATFSLTERAELAYGGMCGTVDPDVGYDMWFHIELGHHRPFMKHLSCDNACTPKYGESMALMRLMTGRAMADTEAQIRHRLLAQIEEGIYWNKAEDFRPWRCMYNWDATDTNPRGEDLASPVGTARMMRTLITWRETEGDSGYDELIREMVGGQIRMLVEKDTYAYFPDAGYGEAYSYPRNTGWYHEREAQDELDGMEGSVNCYHGHTAYVMSVWHRLTGDERALELARKVCAYAMHPRFWGGVALSDEEASKVATTALNTAAPNAPKHGPSPVGMPASLKGHWFSHFHGRAVGLRGMLEYGMTAGDQRVIEFVHNAYQYSKSWMADRLGWIDGAPTKGEWCEGCNLADLAALQIRLSDAGVGDYWDDLDALVRNALAEQQFTDADELRRVAFALPEETETPVSARNVQPGQVYVGEDIFARVVGTIACGSMPNGTALTTIGCCTGNATLAFYYAWEAAVREDPGMTRVNLLLHRAARTVDVVSWLPYQGRVQIHVKAADRVAVRIPNWVPRHALRVTVSGLDRPLLWVGAYVLVDALTPGAVIEVTFPMVESRTEYLWAARTPAETRFTAEFRGSTCVAMSPEPPAGNGIRASYRRAHLRTAEAPIITHPWHVPVRVFRNW